MSSFQLKPHCTENVPVLKNEYQREHMFGYSLFFFIETQSLHALCHNDQFRIGKYLFFHLNRMTLRTEISQYPTDAVLSTECF